MYKLYILRVKGPHWSKHNVNNATFHSILLTQYKIDKDIESNQVRQILKIIFVDLIGTIWIFI